MSVRATSSWKVGAGNLASLVEVVATEEDWEGEAEDAEKPPPRGPDGVDDSPRTCRRGGKARGAPEGPGAIGQG